MRTVKPQSGCKSTPIIRGTSEREIRQRLKRSYWQQLALAATMTLVATSALATNIHNHTFDTLCKKVSATEWVVDSNKMHSTLDPVSFVTLDKNNDGSVTKTEFIGALTDASFCSSGRIENPCSESEADKLAVEFDALLYWLENPPDWVEFNNTTETPEAGLAAFMRGEHNDAILRCRPEGQPTGIAAASESLKTFSLANDLPGLRLRGTVDNLPIPLNAGTLGRTLPANFSVTSDQVSDTVTWQSTAFLGYQFQVANGSQSKSSDGSFIRKWDLSLLPYLQYERHVTEGSDAGSSDEVQKLGFGGLIDLTVNTPIPGFGSKSNLDNNFSLRPLYLTDASADTSILELEVVYTPTPRIFREDAFSSEPHWSRWIPLNQVTRFESLGLGAVLHADARWQFGHVADDGGRTELSDANEYNRLGTRLELILFGLNGSALDRFQIYGNYEYFNVFSGPFDDIERFEAGINYTFPDLEHFGIGFRYVNGRESTTLEDVEYYQATLNARF